MTITHTDGRPLRVADLQQEIEMITRLERMWADAAGEPVEVRIIGDRVVGYTKSELGALRIESQWSSLARNRYPSTHNAGVLGWAYAMDHLMRMEPVPERAA